LLVQTLGTDLNLHHAQIVLISNEGSEPVTHTYTYATHPQSDPASEQVCRIPFRIGPNTGVTVQLSLRQGMSWTDAARKLAHAYVNTARASLRVLERLHRMEEQSLTDPLTHLYNRRALKPMLRRELALAERYGNALSVVMIDVDHFKQINDTLGHAVGDWVLRSLAESIRSTLRKTDLAFRVGGDEFVVVLPHTSAHAAGQAVQHLQNAVLSIQLPRPVPILGTTLTLSIGITQRGPSESISVQSLLTRADQALYTAKNADRNCVRIASAA
jgi:diguanylate cyclase (GGDEF)-like protein